MGVLWLQAQQVAQYVHKGMQIAVGGHLKQSKWTDKTTGQRREALRVIPSHAVSHMFTIIPLTCRPCCISLHPISVTSSLNQL